MTRFCVALSIASVCLSGSVLLADVVELKNGQRVEGTLVKADASTVQVEVGGQTVTFKAEQVRAIYYGTAPVVAPTAPSSTNEVPKPASEVLRALKNLQSAVSSGLTYRDYGPRLADASIVVDRLLETPVSGDEVGRTAISEAIGFYRLAAKAWSHKVSGDRVQVLLLSKSETAMARKCQGAVSGDGSRPQALMTTNQSALKPEFQGEDVLQTLWNCASTRIVTAEQAYLPGR